MIPKGLNRREPYCDLKLRGPTHDHMRVAGPYGNITKAHFQKSALAALKKQAESASLSFKDSDVYAAFFSQNRRNYDRLSYTLRNKPNEKYVVRAWDSGNLDSGKQLLEPVFGEFRSRLPTKDDLQSGKCIRKIVTDRYGVKSDEKFSFTSAPSVDPMVYVMLHSENLQTVELEFSNRNINGDHTFAKYSLVDREDTIFDNIVSCISDCFSKIKETPVERNNNLTAEIMKRD